MGNFRHANVVKRKKKKAPLLSPDIRALLLIALSFLGFLSLGTFSAGHPSLNLLGYAGYSIAYGATLLFGLAAFLLPTYLFWMSLRIITRFRHPPLYEHLYFSILLVSLSFLFTAFSDQFPAQAAGWEPRILSEKIAFFTPYPRTLTRYFLGGIPFYFLYADLPLLNLQKLFSPQGTFLIFSSTSLVSFLLLTRLPLIPLFLAIGRGARRSTKLFSLPAIKETKKLPAKKASPPEAPPKTLPLAPEEPIIRTSSSLPTPKEKISIPTQNLIVQKDLSFQLPSPTLLSSPAQRFDHPSLKKDLIRQASVLEETLKSFGIEGKVGEIHSGPTITSFEVHPPIGVKVQKIKALENDIALNMEAKSIRIVAPIPGKAAVGVEVPALHPQEVNFQEMLLYYQQKGKKLSIPILLGKSIHGEWLFADLTRMPHLLIAGATGSGKSVCINTIVMSILMNARPEEVKLLMIDPKKVELTQYSDLPHMIAPVITESHGAYAALQWLVREMQVRYEILKQLSLRNISAFNTRKRDVEKEAASSIPIPEMMPFIVAIIDEFADLMMVSSSDIETPIARIAQMARAVGIHLILATQRPSREVITGIIKANIPTRISFKVANRINSQIILDEVGAESLLGNGDLLFIPPGTSQLVRAQGVYISDEEIHRVISSLAKQGPPQYLISSFDNYKPPELAQEKSPESRDPLYEQALTTVLGVKAASTTFLQRKLKIGYARAASLIDELEANGVVGPADGARPRRVLSSSMMEDDDEIS
ncbi:MAG: DNA translocase FtsK 4TM domain-containing protein [Verrucomicrobiota bacterium]|nr:DNA translocase FtsK 4TM domain-containing protein [Verrucomicrobiota bacterium]